jgi:hypothetical protein
MNVGDVCHAIYSDEMGGLWPESPTFIQINIFNPLSV